MLLELAPRLREGCVVVLTVKLVKRGKTYEKVPKNRSGRVVLVVVHSLQWCC